MPIGRNRGRVVPEAEMEISPTLGRWPTPAVASGSGATVRVEEEEEDLAGNVVEVSGLGFAVGLCASSPDRGGGGELREIF